MSRKLIKTGVLVLMVALLALTSLAGCTEEEETEPGNVNIYYPLLIPYSGRYATGYGIVDTTTKALLEYINAEDPIPGVTLKLLTYDSKSTSDVALAGYQYLEGQGAKFIAVTDTEVIPSVKSQVDLDKFPVFMCSGTAVATDPPGYVFPIPMIFYDQIQPLMEYIMDSWDYDSNPSGPKIGLLAWPVEYGLDRRDAIEDYIDDNPGKFADDAAVIQIVSPTATSFTSEVDALKNCDYIFAGATSTAMNPFITLMRSSGYTDPVFCFLGSDTGFMSIYAATAQSRENIDGTLWASDAGYYKTDFNEIADLSRYLVDNYFSEDVTDITPGLTTLVISLLAPIDILREALKDLEDPSDLTGQMIYDATTSMTFDYEDFPTADFIDGNRALLTQVKVYRYDADANDWHPISDWITAPTYAAE